VPLPAPAPAPAAPARGERPPLPRRQAQATLTSQLREHHRGDSAARHAEPPTDQLTGLMADFLKGVSRSEEEDSPARD